MDTEAFKKIGAELFGQSWQTRMARALEIDSSTVRRWVSGTVKVPTMIQAYLDIMIQRQILRGNLVANIQELGEPVEFNFQEYEESSFKRKILFPGIDYKKAMPSVHVKEHQKKITVRLDGQANDEYSKLHSIQITRHPDIYQTRAYILQLENLGYTSFFIKNKNHYYSVTLHNKNEDAVVTYQIITHSGKIRTVQKKIENPDEGFTGILTDLPDADYERPKND